MYAPLQDVKRQKRDLVASMTLMPTFRNTMRKRLNTEKCQGSKNKSNRVSTIFNVYCKAENILINHYYFQHGRFYFLAAQWIQSMCSHFCYWYMYLLVRAMKGFPQSVVSQTVQMSGSQLQVWQVSRTQEPPRSGYKLATRVYSFMLCSTSFIVVVFSVHGSTCISPCEHCQAFQT